MPTPSTSTHHHLRNQKVAVIAVDLSSFMYQELEFYFVNKKIWTSIPTDEMDDFELSSLDNHFPNNQMLKSQSFKLLRLAS